MHLKINFFAIFLIFIFLTSCYSEKDNSPLINLTINQSTLGSIYNNLCNSTEEPSPCWAQNINGTWTQFSTNTKWRILNEIQTYCVNSSDENCNCPSGEYATPWSGGLICIDRINTSEWPKCYTDKNIWAVYNKSSNSYYCVEKCPFGYAGYPEVSDGNYEPKVCEKMGDDLASYNRYTYAIIMGFNFQTESIVMELNNNWCHLHEETASIIYYNNSNTSYYKVNLYCVKNMMNCTFYIKSDKTYYLGSCNPLPP